MAQEYGPKIVTDGLVLCLDAADKVSYPGSGTTWTDLSGNGNNFTMDSAAAWNSDGTMTLADAYGYTYSGNITTSSSSTCVFWMYTTDAQSLFWHKQDGAGNYMGAYRSGAKEYYSDVGSPDFRMDTVAQSNIYDNIPDGNWHMVEFKNCDFSDVTWTSFLFNQYTTYQFGDGKLASMLIYNRDLTAAESTQNFNAQRSRFSV